MTDLGDIYHNEQSPNDELNEMLNDQWKRDHPTFPEKYRPKPKNNKSKSNELTGNVIKYITLKGGWATRVNSMGRKLPSGKWIGGTTESGTPDIMGVIDGKFIGIEIKIKDKQSDDQKNVQAKITKACGFYFITHSMDEFIEQLKLITT